MLNQTNCLNCGAVLEYGTNDYESIAKCHYCGTEYHIDRLGKVEEYKVKLQIMGAIHEFYISEVRLKNMYEPEIFRNLDGRVIMSNTYMSAQQMELELVEM